MSDDLIFENEDGEFYFTLHDSLGPEIEVKVKARLKRGPATVFVLAVFQPGLEDPMTFTQKTLTFTLGAAKDFWNQYHQEGRTWARVMAEQSGLEVDGDYPMLVKRIAFGLV